MNIGPIHLRYTGTKRPSYHHRMNYNFNSPEHILLPVLAALHVCSRQGEVEVYGLSLYGYETKGRL